MPRRDAEVNQFLVALLGVNPLVWRRIQVPAEYSFWDLHVAIQDAMGWQDCHLHEFVIPEPNGAGNLKIGPPSEEGPPQSGELLDYETAIGACFSDNNPSALYTYDFGDGWRHVVVYEGIEIAEHGADYPRCIASERACPPEDCGGPGGYAHFLEATRDPSQEDHEDLLEWIGFEFDPGKFDPAEVSFDDPGERWRIAYEEP